MSTQSFGRILEIFDRHGVEYIVVGGVAAVLQGAPLTTFDIDTLVKVDESNAVRLLAALDELNARFREHQRYISPTLEQVLAGGHLLLMTSCGPLDVLGFIGKGKRYEDLEGSSPTVVIGSASVRVLSLAALIEEKRALGRDKDRAAIALLESVQNKTRGG